MWIERCISPRLKRLAASRPVVVVTGARQTGKTALLRRLFPDHHGVTLELPSEASQAEQDPVAVLKRHPAPLIVDEVDEDRSSHGRYRLSGSQPLALMQGVSESLSGRASILKLGDSALPSSGR